MEIAEIHWLAKRKSVARPWIDQALQMSTKATTLDATNLESQRALAAYDRLQNNFVKAQEKLNQAISQDPNDADTYIQMARLFLTRKGLEDTAQQYLEKALKINDRSIRAHRYQAITQDRKQHHDKARSHWNKVLELNQEHQMAQFEVARLTKKLSRKLHPKPPKPVEAAESVPVQLVSEVSESAPDDPAAAPPEPQVELE